MYDILFIGSKNSEWERLKDRFPTTKHISNLGEVKKKSFTKFFWLVPNDVVVLENFDFVFEPDQWSTDYVHVFKNGMYTDGIALFPKQYKITEEEFNVRTYTKVKFVDVVASSPADYPVYEIDNYEEYCNVLDTTPNEMFWMSSKNITATIPSIHISKDNTFDRTINHAFIHQVGNTEYYNGVFLCSKHSPLSETEVERRTLSNHKEWNIIASGPVAYDHFYIETYEEYLAAMQSSKTEMFWMDSYNIKSTIPDIYFTHDNVFDRTHNHNFIHRANGEDSRKGLFLLSKHSPLTKREIEYRFIVNAKEWDIVASGPVEYPVYEIDSYDEYLCALGNCKTEMFWMSSRNLKADIPDLYLTDEFDRKINHAFIHRANGIDSFNGVVLCSKHSPLSKREVEYRFPVNRKEWNVVASSPIKYDKFVVNTYAEYLDALKNTTSELFWATSDQLDIDPGFNFSTYFNMDNTYDRQQNHSFINMCNGEEKTNGVFLLSMHSPVSEKEIKFRHLVNSKKWDIVASKHKPYDIVFISYQEPNAADNYNRLQERFPQAKRIHGVKGIHQAHIAAAELCNSEMFWVVDGDAIIDSNFDFSYYVETWDRDAVHVWRSRNPINDLEYGYGGVKLLPRKLTLEMDTTQPDMTTSISDKFNAMQLVSNVTAFNTDPFNTWKSAFRECVKLASKTIKGQVNEETDNRLNIWCNTGMDRPFGEYAIAGAIAGRSFAEEHASDIYKINDFDWLYEQYSRHQ